VRLNIFFALQFVYIQCRSAMPRVDCPAVSIVFVTGVLKMFPLAAFVRELSVWFMPVVIAVTFHEAAHGFVAHLRGDDTAWRCGRVSFNPMRHIDPFGTILLPGILLLMRSPFLIGYAKPVPVDFGALRNPRTDMVLVAAAGPVTNLLLAFAAALGFHFIGSMPSAIAGWLAANLNNAVVINVILAIFNLLPVPPLDGGRIAVGLLPRALSIRLAALEPFGMLIVIGLVFVLPMAGTSLGLRLDFVSQAMAKSADQVIAAIGHLAGLG
jgi:Zn-dependent protease